MSEELSPKLIQAGYTQHVPCGCVHCAIDKDLLESFREKIGKILLMVGEKDTTLLDIQDVIL